MNNMKKILLALVPLFIVGCNAGDAPTGGSEAETKAVFDAQPLDAKVKFFMNSPMPMADKKKKIEELYQKEGKEMPADLFSSAAPAPGAPPIDTTGGQRR
jgi:hypothetical protein